MSEAIDEANLRHCVDKISTYQTLLSNQQTGLIFLGHKLCGPARQPYHQFNQRAAVKLYNEAIKCSKAAARAYEEAMEYMKELEKQEEFLND